MDFKKYIVIVLLLFTVLYSANNYKEKKYYIDRNIKYQLSSTANIINNSTVEFDKCLVYSKIVYNDKSQSDSYIPLIIGMLRSETNDIQDSYFGVIELRELNSNIIIDLSDFISGIETLTKRIETENKIEKKGR